MAAWRGSGERKGEAFWEKPELSSQYKKETYLEARLLSSRAKAKPWLVKSYGVAAPEVRG